MDDFSKSALVEFLDFLGRKGLMNAATVSSRKAAVNTLLGILSDEEASDVRNLDIDLVATRFLSLRGADFKPDSVKVYKSRVSGAIQDFVNYRKDPLAFRPSASPRRTTGRRETVETRTPERPSGDERLVRPSSFEDVSFPIPIRSDVIVRLVGIPSDLTIREARKIANVIMALAPEGDD